MALLWPYYGYAHVLWQVTNSIFESAMRDRYDAIGVFSSGVVTLSAEVTAQHKIKVRAAKRLRGIRGIRGS